MSQHGRTRASQDPRGTRRHETSGRNAAGDAGRRLELRPSTPSPTASADGASAPVTPPLAPAHGSTDARLSEPAAGEDEPRRARAGPPRQPPRRDDEVDAEAPERRLESYRVRPDMDVWVIPRFAQDVLGFDPAWLQRALEENYPVVGAGDEIEASAAQWVDGANAALNYRGRALKRSKMWFQRGDPRTSGYVKYYYTGWQKNVLPATSDVGGCPEAPPIADKYDEWAVRMGYPPANHYIVTKYVHGAQNILADHSR